MNETLKQALPVGARIGAYEIRRVIGAGRFGITYLVWNQHLNAEMALKEYFPGDIVQRAADGLTVLTSSDGDERLFQLGLDRFSEEADKLSRIDHPNLECIQNDLQIHGTIYLAMEYEDGIPLNRLGERSDTVLDEEQVKVIFLPIIEALGKVHEAGVIHGDVNPGNIMLRKSGESVLLDFSAARLALAASLGVCLEVFNEGYAPVEQYDPQGQIGPWTDLYSLGATMYRCVTGNNPLSATDRLSEVSQGKSDPQRSAVEAAASGYHEDFLKAIDWMLAIRPEDRPQSVGPLLESLTAGSDYGAEAGGVSRQKTDAEFAKTKPTASHKKARPAVPLLIFAGITAVLLIVTGLWYTGRDRRADEILATAEQQRMASLGHLEDKAEVPEVAPSPVFDVEQENSDTLLESSASLSEGADAGDESLAPRHEVTAVDADPSTDIAETEAVSIDLETEMVSADATTGAHDTFKVMESEGEPVSVGTERLTAEALPESESSPKIASIQAIDEAGQATQTTSLDSISEHSLEVGAGTDLVATHTQVQDESAGVENLPENDEMGRLSASEIEQVVPAQEDVAALESSASIGADLEGVEDRGSDMEGPKGSTDEAEQETQTSPSDSISENSMEVGVGSDLVATQVQDESAGEEILPESNEMGRLPASKIELAVPAQQDVAALESSVSIGADLEGVEVQGSDMEGPKGSPASSTEPDRLQSSMQAAMVQPSDESPVSHAEPSAASSVALHEEMRLNTEAETGENTIAQHMAAAEEDIAALRLSTPQGDNALEHYRAVLALDSDHSVAQEGLRRIVDVYVLLIDKAIEQDKLVAARIYLQRAEEILPDTPKLQQARFDLSALQTADEVESTEAFEVR